MSIQHSLHYVNFTTDNIGFLLQYNIYSLAKYTLKYIFKTLPYSCNLQLLQYSYIRLHNLRIKTSGKTILSVQNLSLTFTIRHCTQQ